MSNQFTGNTFANTYKDDFADSAGYHKVLFNSGRPLQARELTQLQTILQTQITRFAANIFQDGAAISPKSSGAQTSLQDYVIVEALFDDVADLIGAEFTGPAVSNSDGAKFVITHVEVASNGDYPVIYGRYSSAEQAGNSTDAQTSTVTFAEGQELTHPSLTNMFVRTRVDSSETNPIGVGTLFSMQQAEFFTQGHFVYAPKQTIVIGKHSSSVDADVGFEVVQDIVTVADDEALYDNQGARPNLSSPGADRYRIRLVLTTKASVADPLDFVSFAFVRDSRIVQIKDGTSGFNQVERRMAERQFDTTGDFIVNEFELNFEEKDSATMTFVIPATQAGNKPTAFVDGFHLELPLDVALDVSKPVSFVEDSDVLSNAIFKNYVSVSNVDSSAGRFNPEAADWNQLREVALWDDSTAGANQIGTARIRSFRSTGAVSDSDAHRAHLIDVQMDAGQNFRAVKAIGRADQTGDAGFIVDQEDGQSYLIQPEVSTALFEIPGNRVKSTTNVKFSVQRFGTDTVDASQQIAFAGLGTNEEYTDEGQWVFINQTQNYVDVIPVTDINTTTSTALVDVTGAENDVYSVYFYVRKNEPTATVKQYKEEWVDFTRTVSGGDSDFSVSGSMFDGVELIEAYLVDSNGSSVMGNIEFDGGQRDNYYGPVVLKPVGLNVNATSIKAKVGYFDWQSQGDYISVSSYDLSVSGFDYGDIPTYVSKTSGVAYPLHNYFDFRQKLDPTLASQASVNHVELPRDGDQISAHIEYYNQRIDQVVLTYEEDLTPRVFIHPGREEQQPRMPDPIQKGMVLYSVMLNGNTKGVDDMMVQKNRYPRYTMADIGQLEQRVEDLEETVSLSFLEQEASNLVELNSEGGIRSKTGFFVDDFTKGMAFTASAISTNFIDDQFFITETLDADNTQILPKHSSQFTELNYDATDLYNARGAGNKANVVRKGNQLMLEYQEVLDSTLSQPLISWKSTGSSEEHGYYNVNPFNVFSGEGVVRLNPSVDRWFDNVRLPDRHIRGATVRRNRNPITNFTPTTTTSTRSWISARSTSFTGRTGLDIFGRRINEWETRTTRTTRTTTSTTRVRNRVVSDEQITRNLGDRIVRVQGVPFLRNRRVVGKAEGLRPRTRYWLYFGGVRMDQWVLDRTETQHIDDIAAGIPQRSYGYSNVSLKTHPLTTGATTNVLVTDDDGNLYFDLWIPNTARIPMPRSRIFNYTEELRTWTARVKRGVQLHGKDSPLVYDYAGWKFRAGSQTVKLLDISENNENNALSRARSTFFGGGRVRQWQRSFLTFRSIVTEDFISTETSEEDTTRTTTTTRWRPSDPLAQTFTVDAVAGCPGVFVTKIDVFIRNCPSASDVQVPLELQIREVRDGTPMRAQISEQHRMFKPASEVRTAISGMNKTNYESVLAHPVTFEFEEPFYLRSGEEYAIVLKAECDDYEAYVASTYDLILGKTDKRVSKQPATGSLFLSQNGSTWTPKQNQDLAYFIHTAKFKDAGVANFFPSELPRFRHNFSTSLSVDSDDKTKFRVNQLNHNLGVGDKVRLTGLDSAATYFGVAATELMDSTNVVVSADVNGYEVKSTGAANDFAFDSAGFFGSDSVTTNQAFNVDRLVLGMNQINFEDTVINWSGSFVSGLPHANNTGTRDTRFDIDDVNTQGTNADGKISMQNEEEVYFTSPRYFANEDQVDSALSGVPSFIIGAELSTNQTSTFGGPKGRSNIGTYPSDVSPVIDLQGGGVTMINYVIDNQPADSAGAGAEQNYPADYVRETNATQGTTPSKHITKVVNLEQAANGIRVFLEIHKPAEASFDLYYRTSRDVDEDIYTINWERVEAQNSPEDHTFLPGTVQDVDFSDYKYLIGGEDGDLDDFTSFQLKVVFRSTNTCVIPIMRSIRAIAVI